MTMSLTSNPLDDCRLRRLVRAVALLSFLCSWPPLFGQPNTSVEPIASYLFPAGGQRGTEVDVRVGGMFLHDACHVVVSGDGVDVGATLNATETLLIDKVTPPKTYFPQETKFPRDYAAHVSVAADADLGAKYLRLWTSQGATTQLAFIVGDFPEVVEEEVAGDPLPEHVTLPVTTNGRIYPREDVDIWSFEAKSGDTITCEVRAARLGSSLESFLEVRGPDGGRIAENSGYYGSDAMVRFTAPVDGVYAVHVSDIRFGGLQSSVYRLTMTADAYVDVTYPLGGRAGRPVQVELVGSSLSKQAVALRMPRMSTSAFRVVVPSSRAAGSRVELDLGRFPEKLEVEPNDAPSTAMEVSLPVTVNGRIDTRDDVDHWAVVANKDETIEFGFLARSSGSPLDPLLVVLDPEGREVTRSEASGSFTAPKPGRYELRVVDVFGGRGGPSFAYRLELKSPGETQADYQLALTRPSVTLTRGKPAELTVRVVRSGGFDAPIDVNVGPLPAGVSVDPVTIAPGKPEAKIIFKAAPKTRIRATRLQVTGVATANGFRMRRTASFPVDYDGGALDDVLLAVAMPTPFKFAGKYEIPFALRGTYHYRHYKLHRGGFEGPIFVRLSDVQIRHQQGSTGRTITIPPGINEFDYPFRLSHWIQVGKTSRTVVMAYADVEDFDGSLHRVAYTSGGTGDQIMVQPSAEPLGIAVQPSAIEADSTQPVQVRVRIIRDSDLPLPALIEVVPARHVRGIAAAPVLVPADADEAVLSIRCAPTAGPFNAPLVIRATIDLPRDMDVRGRPLRRGDPVVARTELEIVSPPEVATSVSRASD